ncbi:MAG: hypothetical protein KKE16_01405 [Firmicutes bacterium]|nr:hypothetical protein [Bacillota bacterium]
MKKLIIVLSIIVVGSTITAFTLIKRNQRIENDLVYTNFLSQFPDLETFDELSVLEPAYPHSLGVESTNGGYIDRSEIAIPGERYTENSTAKYFVTVVNDLKSTFDSLYDQCPTFTESTNNHCKVVYHKDTSYEVTTKYVYRMELNEPFSVFEVYYQNMDSNRIYYKRLIVDYTISESPTYNYTFMWENSRTMETEFTLVYEVKLGDHFIHYGHQFIGEYNYVSLLGSDNLFSRQDSIFLETSNSYSFTYYDQTNNADISINFYRNDDDELDYAIDSIAILDSELRTVSKTYYNPSGEITQTTYNLLFLDEWNQLLIHQDDDSCTIYLDDVIASEKEVQNCFIRNGILEFDIYPDEGDLDSFGLSQSYYSEDFLANVYSSNLDFDYYRTIFEDEFMAQYVNYMVPAISEEVYLNLYK